MASRLYNLFFIHFFLVCSLSCSAQSLAANIKIRVDSLVNIEMQKQNIPGVSIVIINDGKIDYVKGYGYANLEHRVAVKPETIFQAGSVGKQFTAFAIMLVVEDGKISLDDTLTRFFPDAPPSWDSVTVKHLLTHTAGFGEYTNDPEFNFREDYSEDSLYRIFSKKTLIFKPGEKSHYSNMGYVTLGLIISKLTGKFYGDFLKQRIFEPLEMHTARVITESDIVPNRAAGYRLENEEIKNQEWVSPSINTTADGSLYVTALDMAKWEAGLNAGKLLKKESYEAMWSPVKLNDGSTFPYGFGWSIDSLNGKKILEHNGSWQGFESTIKRYPGKKTAVIVFANLKRANTYKITTRILQLIQPELASAKLKPIKDNDPQATALIRNFVEKLIDNTVTENMLTPEFGSEFLPHSARTSAFLKQQGTFLRMELLERRNADKEMRVHHYRLVFSLEVIEIMVTLTKDNVIAGIEGRE